MTDYEVSVMHDLSSNLVFNEIQRPETYGLDECLPDKTVK